MGSARSTCLNLILQTILTEKGKGSASKCTLYQSIRSGLGLGLFETLRILIYNRTQGAKPWVLIFGLGRDDFERRISIKVVFKLCLAVSMVSCARAMEYLHQS